jgi:SRSO17 transposase
LTEIEEFDLQLGMTPRQLKKLERQLKEFVEKLTTGLGRSERREALQLYVTGLLLDGERKSIQPMAARLVDHDDEVEAMRQRLQQAVVVADWDDDVIRSRLAKMVEAEMPGVSAFVFDDTGFPKKGDHSVAVARQYSGTLGRTDNCQVATSLHLAGEKGSACIGMQLYVPDDWVSDPKRLRLAKVPEAITFKRKWEIALDLLDRALSWGVRRHVALADSGYGDSVGFRDGLRERGLHYLVGVAGAHSVWPPGAKPKRIKGIRGQLLKRFVDAKHEPVPISELAEALPVSSFRRISARPSSRFAFVRVRPAEMHARGRPPDDEHWLICEWVDGELKPNKFMLCSLPPTTTIKELIRLLKLRWRVERDYQELKGEIGLDHFEGRTWPGFHHHATLCAAAHAFLALRRALSPPELHQLDLAYGA